MPIFLCMFLVFCAWAYYERSKSTRQEKQEEQNFWDAERLANQTRKQDLSNLPYITLSPDDLPIQSDTTDANLLEYYKELRDLKTKKIVNLSAYTNTEIKAKYGIANFDLLTEYDQNYTTLIVTLNKWGNYLFDSNCYTEAQTVLEYALLCQSDISKTYTTLAKIYTMHKDTSKLNELLARAKDLHSTMSVKIVDELEKMKLECLYS